MRAELFRSLAALPRLAPANAGSSAISCNVCGLPARFFDVIDFNKYTDGYTPCQNYSGGYTFGPSDIAVPWFRCEACESLFTPFFNDWTAEEFSTFIYNTDYIKVDPGYSGARPARLIEFLARVLGSPAGLRILDYGSGAGIVVAGLLQRGYDISGYDPFSSPARPEGLFDLVTCFEVMEHSPDPMGLLRDVRSLLRPDGGLLLGQALQPANIDEIRCNWWYCAPRNGHCSTFSARTLAIAAERLGWSFHTGGGQHSFTSRDGGPIAELLERVSGPRLTAVTLGAPPVIPAAGWHGIEQHHVGPFRWTASDVITWRVPFDGKGVLDVQIPVRMAIQPDFPKECRIRIGGQETETIVRTTGLAARISGLTPTDGAVIVELHTPVLPTPRELRGAADDRPLGLAVPVL